MTEIEIYAPGLREQETISHLNQALSTEPLVRYKVDLNHDLVYFEIDDPTKISLKSILRYFDDVDLKPRVVGAVPPELPLGASDTQRLT